MEYLLGLLVLSPFTAVILGIVAIYLIAKKRLNVTFNYWTTSLLVLFFWSLFVSILNKSLLSAGGSLLILIYFFVAQFSNKLCGNKDSLHKAFNMLILLTSVAAIGGIIEKIVFVFLGYGGHRIFSAFGNPNMAGSWFATLIFVVAYMASTDFGKKYQTRYALSAILMVLALFLTGSRGSYISLAVTACLVAVVRGVKLNKKIVLTVSLVSVFIIAIAIFAESKLISEYILAHPFEDSINPRMKIWNDGIQLIKAKPLTGWGLLATIEHGNKILPTYNQATIHVHNLWLMLLSTLGIIGFSIYAYMKYHLFRNLITLYKNNKNLALLFLSVNMIVMVQGIVDVSLYAPQLGIVFSLTGAMVTDLTKARSASIGKLHVKRISNSNYKNQKIAG